MFDFSRKRSYRFSLLPMANDNRNQDRIGINLSPIVRMSDVAGARLLTRFGAQRPHVGADRRAALGPTETTTVDPPCERHPTRLAELDDRTNLDRAITCRRIRAATVRASSRSFASTTAP
jgi:hypothetical protein